MGHWTQFEPSVTAGSGFHQLKREIISAGSFANLILHSALTCAGLKIQ